MELDRGKVREDFKRVVKIKNKIMVPLEYEVNQDSSEIARLSNAINNKENVEYVIEKIGKNLYEYIKLYNGQISTKIFNKFLDLSKVKNIYNLTEVFEAVTLEVYDETLTRFHKDDEIMELVNKIKKHSSLSSVRFEEVKELMSIDTMEEMACCLDYRFGHNRALGFWEEVINDKNISIGDVVKWRFRQIAEEFEEAIDDAILIDKTVYSFKEHKFGRIEDLEIPILGKIIRFEI